ncbi:hypothetical protein ACVMB3_007065 [Sinorhizobium meliloti]
MDRTAILRAVDACFDRELEFLTELLHPGCWNGTDEMRDLRWLA